MDYVCAAYPGNANQAISRMAINSCSNNKDSFLLVTWTYPQRAEFMFSNKWKSINSWHTTEKEFSKQYFNYIDSEYFELYSTLKEILFLLDKSAQGIGCEIFAVNLSRDKSQTIFHFSKEKIVASTF
jgi:hypothetical protein